MTLSNIYEDFGSPSSAKPGKPGRKEAASEEELLESFDSGYKAGWDDAAKAQEEARAHISAEFSKTLQEVSFAYHEARSTLATELGDFLQPLLETLLPKVAHAALVGHVTEKLEDLAKTCMDRPIEVVVSPARMVPFREAFDEHLNEPFVVVPDESLDDDSVFIRLGDTEQAFELAPWLEEIHGIVDAHFKNSKKETPNV